MVQGQGARQGCGTVSGDADSNLVRAAQDGARDAYGELVRRYQDRIYTVVLGMVSDPEDALDLTQETFLKGYMGLSRFRAEAGFYTWLYRIAVHLCIDHSRKRKRRQEAMPLDEYLPQDPSREPEDPSPARDPERATMNLLLREAIRTSLRKISEPFRTALILHDVEGLS